MADKISFHFWTITDYEKEEQFLRDQHREGWSLRRYLLLGFYLFDRCEPRDMVYRLDFDQAAKWEKTEYLKMYRDYGWEYLFEVNGFSYFRKPSDGAEDEDIEIFSDNESRLEMVRRIFRRRMVPLLCIFLCGVIPQLFIQSFLWTKDGYVASKVLTITYLILFVMYIYLFVYCGIGIRRLKQKYEKSFEE